MEYSDLNGFSQGEQELHHLDLLERLVAMRPMLKDRGAWAVEYDGESARHYVTGVFGPHLIRGGPRRGLLRFNLNSCGNRTVVPK